MATSSSAPAHFPNPFEKSFDAGKLAAIRWFRADTKRIDQWRNNPEIIANYRHEMRVQHCTEVIFTHQPGRIPLVEACSGFNAGFASGVRQSIKGDDHA